LLDLECWSFEIEAMMNVRALRAGLTVGEVRSFEYRRVYGTSNLHTVRDGMRVLRTIMRERLRPAPAQVAAGAPTHVAMIVPIRPQVAAIPVEADGIEAIYAEALETADRVAIG